MDGETQVPETPQSTSEIAANTLDTLERESTPVEDAAPSQEETPAAPVTEQPTAEELSAAAKFLLGQGHKAKKDDGRAVWLPYGTVEKMLDRYANEHRLTWDGERGVIEKERDQYRNDWAEFSKDFQGDPWAFVEKLAQTDQRYKVIADLRNGPQRQETQDDPEPQLVLDQGNEAFLKSLAALRAWDRNQVTKPLREREQQEVLQRKLADDERTSKERYQQTMADMAKRPMFGELPADGSLTPFQTEVLQEMKAERTRAEQRGERNFRPDIEKAYHIVYNRHQRESVINELKAQPTSTAVPRTTQGTPPKQGAPTTQEIAARTLERLTRGG